MPGSIRYLLTNSTAPNEIPARGPGRHSFYLGRWLCLMVELTSPSGALSLRTHRCINTNKIKRSMSCRAGSLRTSMCSRELCASCTSPGISRTIARSPIKKYVMLGLTRYLLPNSTDPNEIPARGPGRHSFYLGRWLYLMVELTSPSGALRLRLTHPCMINTQLLDICFHRLYL